jgi:hypothetical protein
MCRTKALCLLCHFLYKECATQTQTMKKYCVEHFYLNIFSEQSLHGSSRKCKMGPGKPLVRKIEGTVV